MEKLKSKNGIFYVVISLVAVLGVAGLIRAYSLSQNINVTGDYNYYEADSQSLQPLEEFGAQSAPDSLSIQEVNLDFTAGATTTPGSLFKILNVGGAKVCDLVEVDVTDGTATGGATGSGNAMAFSVSTSTSGSAFSTKSGGVIASTTIPTSTAALFSNVRHPGSYVGGDQDVGGESFVWGNGVYLLGAFDDASLSSGGADFSTSSAAYVGMGGKAFIRCHVR